MFQPLLDNLSKWNVIVGLIVALLGFALLLAAKAIASRVKKDKPAEEQQKLGLTLKMISIAPVLAGCIMVMFIP